MQAVGLVKFWVFTGKKQHFLNLVGQKANVGQMVRQEHCNPPWPSFTSTPACFPWQRHIQKTPQRSVTPLKKSLQNSHFRENRRGKSHPAGLLFILKSSPLLNVNTEINKSNKNTESDKEQLTEAAVRSTISTQQMTGNRLYPTLFSKADGFAQSTQRMWKMISGVMVGATKWLSKVEETLKRRQCMASSFIASNDGESDKQPNLQLCSSSNREEESWVCSHGAMVLLELCRRGEVD